MVIKVNIPAGVTSVTIDPLHQWDYGQILEIGSGDNLPSLFEVHFSCSDMPDAIVRSCSSSNGYTVEVPNPCLEQSSDITAWIYETDGTSGKTVKTITIPIFARPRPNRGGEISESTANVYSEAIAMLNEIVSKLSNGDITVKKAETATTAGTAQMANSANEANVANEVGVATELATKRYMVYVKIRQEYESSNDFECDFDFSFIANGTKPIETEITTLAGLKPFFVGSMPEGFLAIGNGFYFGEKKGFGSYDVQCSLRGIYHEGDSIKLQSTYDENGDSTTIVASDVLNLSIRVVPLVSEE